MRSGIFKARPRSIKILCFTGILAILWLFSPVSSTVISQQEHTQQEMLLIKVPAQGVNPV